jgi:tetratricopeptide (TPR) repeat protein
MRRFVLAALVVVSACAPKVIPAPVVTTPKYPEFVRPAVPPGLAATVAATSHDRGWAFLQTGDLRTAEREFATALRVAPTFYPSETALGWLEMARKDAGAALPHFERALELNPQHADFAASIGRAQALLALGREGDALAAFEAALALEPNDVDLAQRIEVLKFRGLEQGLARARDLARGGRLDDAVRAYTSAIASSPESPFLYRELAAVERQKGDLDAAQAHFEKAVSLDPTDARSVAQIGDILVEKGDIEGADKAYSDSLAIEPNEDVERRLDELRARVALSRLPAEYRAIDDAAQMTRGDLAALIGVRLAPLVQGGNRRADAALITDVRSHWAATWIMAVARAGVIEPYANHAFQPRGLVHRIDLAQAVARLLAQVAAQDPSRARAWDSARLKFSDLSAAHIAYPAASAAVASGVMSTGPDASFQPSRVVSGAEAIEAVQKIEALAGLR